MNVILVILSGGVGSRLWPLSRKSRPKQYIPLFENHSLFQLCALRNQNVCKEMVVVGNQKNQEISRSNLTQIGIKKYLEITETVPRNTAAAIAFAALKVAHEDILLITPSDHILTNQKAYESCVREAVSLAAKGFLVTFGITPTRPETGYGYIEHEGNEVKSFIEKPDLNKAEEMLNKGNFLWNSGMFCFKASTFLEELEKYAPEVAQKALKAWQQRQNDLLPRAESLEIPAISVDYAVMEHSQKVKVIPTKDLGWSDLGTFDALWDYCKSSNQAHSFEHLIINSQKPVFVLGEQQMIYVETDDAILILPHGKGQEVKNLYENLEKEQPELVK